MTNQIRSRFLLLTAGDIGAHVAPELARMNLAPAATVDLLERQTWTGEDFAALLDEVQPEFVAAALWRPYPQWMRALNGELHRRNIIWTLGLLHQTQVHIGPTFVPEKTACYACFLRRYYSNSNMRRVELPLSELYDADPNAGHHGQLPAVNRFAAGLLALEIRRIAEAKLDEQCTFSWYELVDGAHGRHRILRTPWCGVCAKSDAREASVAMLRPALAHILEGSNADVV